MKKEFIYRIGYTMQIKGESELSGDYYTRARNYVEAFEAIRGTIHTMLRNQQRGSIQINALMNSLKMIIVKRSPVFHG